MQPTTQNTFTNHNVALSQRFVGATHPDGRVYPAVPNCQCLLASLELPLPGFDPVRCLVQCVQRHQEQQSWSLFQVFRLKIDNLGESTPNIPNIAKNERA